MPAGFPQIVRTPGSRARFARTSAIATLLVLSAPVLDAEAQGLTLQPGAASATLTLEVDASANAFGDTVSLAPDLAVGVHRDLTLALVHSTFARTGFRGSAGAGVCVTDACSSVYDNVGLEATYSLARGPFAAAALAGVHAWSFDRDFYVAKLGGRLRYSIDRVVFASLPSLTLAVTERDATVPNRDRIWLPVTANVSIASGVSLGVGTGFKAALDDIGETYEVAAALLAGYAYSPALSFGASWVHGKILGGDAVLPGDMSGIDSRAIHVWVTANR